MTNVELVSLFASIASLVLAAFTIYWSNATNRETSSLLREMNALQSAVRERLEFVATTTAKNSDRIIDSMLGNHDFARASQADTGIVAEAIVTDEDPQVAFGITRVAYDSLLSESFGLALGLGLNVMADEALGSLANLVRSRATEIAGLLDDAAVRYMAFKKLSASSVGAGDVASLRDDYVAARKAMRAIALMSGFAMRGALAQPADWE